MTLSTMLAANGKSYGDAAKEAGCDKSVIAKVISRTYHKWEEKEKELIDILLLKGYTESIPEQLRINTRALVRTQGLSDFETLADDLSDPDGSLSSSLGMAIGTAERGKTHAAKWYCEQNDRAVYILYVDGSSRVQLLRDICERLAHVRPYSFGACMMTIEETCKYSRRLIIIDEADKCPLQILEMIRGINERCSVPFLLVGEEALKSKCDRVPRLHSRIRRPVCVFEPITAVDVAAFYQISCGVTLDRPLVEHLLRRSSGGFRSVVNDSLSLAKIARASGICTITKDMLTQLAA